MSFNTIKRDLDCFMRTYTFSTKKGEITEDSIECPLAELGLIFPTFQKVNMKFKEDQNLH